MAARQLGVVSRAQVRACGLSNEQIRRLVRDGWLHRLHHNVFAVGHGGVPDRARLLGALLTAGPRSFLSHRTAAAVYGLRVLNVHEIEVTIPGTGGRRRAGLALHRTASAPHPDDVRVHGHLRASSVPRMLVELATRETAEELARLVTQAVRRRLLRPDTRDGRASLQAALDRHDGFPGMPRLRPVLAAYLRTTDHKSELERAFDRLLAQHPELPDPQRNINIGPWEIDRFWPEHNLAVELDGRPYHVAVADMERDRIKDTALQKLGVSPVRFTDFRVTHDADGMLRDLRHFLQVPAAPASGAEVRPRRPAPH